jgi:excisionase family DNA binding protein
MNPDDLSSWAQSVPVQHIPTVIAQLFARLITENSQKPDSLEPKATEPLVDAPEMAKLLNVPESWVRTEQRAGRIPFVPVGRYIRFCPSEVLSALKK